MINKIRHYFSVAQCLMSMAIKRQLEWLFTYISIAISLPLKCAAGLVMIYVLVDRFSPLYGWSFSQLVFLYGLSYVSEGLASGFAAQAWKIEVYIIRGDFDRSLVRPINVLFQFLFRFIYLVSFLDVVSGAIVLAYGCISAGFSLSFLNIAKMFAAIIGATLIRMAFLIIVGSTAFWTKRSGALLNTGDELMRRTTQYPLTIYPSIFQALFTFILPFGFISFYPTSNLLKMGGNFSLPLNLVALTPVIGIILFVVSNKVFVAGLKIYESAGA